MKTREDLIDELVRDEIDTIEQMILQNDYTYIDSIVRYGGILGLDNMTNEDLIEKYYSRFDEVVGII